MYSPVSLSIALVTRNRPESLERSLISLRAQETQPSEVIISDDSDPESAEATAQIANRFECVYSPGPRRGLYANRNAAFLLCRGTHVRTMDDDHTLPPGHLSACLSAVLSDPGAVWSTGERGFVAGRLVEAAATAGQLGPAGVAEPVQNLDDNWAIADGSTVYPRAIFDQGFRMIEIFRFGSSYLEFGAYLYRHGWKCRCVPGAIVEHHVLALGRPDPLSHLFASICYNRYFRPSRFRLFRYLVPHWESWTKLPGLFAMARQRWEKL